MGSLSVCAAQKGLGLLLLLLASASATVHASFARAQRLAREEEVNEKHMQGHHMMKGRHRHRLGPRGLPLFVDRLTVPVEVELKGGKQLTITAFKTLQKFHRDLPPTAVYAFGEDAKSAAVPGPTLVAHPGQTVRVRWRNAIDDHTHLFPVDRTLGVPKPLKGGVPISVHLHGAIVASTSDGHPDAWATAFNETGPAFTSFVHTYHNTQGPSTLWYHDHTVGMTRVNVAAGLKGLYLLRDVAQAQQLGLPTGAFDIPLVLEDKSFNLKTGQIRFPAIGDNPHIHPTWVPETFGDYLLVNGKVSPFLTVQARTYRFRILNGANARFFALAFAPRLHFAVVATDHGYLPKAHYVKELLIAPGERFEIVVDFGGLPPNAKVTLTNSAPTPYKSGDPPETLAQKSVIQFRVHGKPKAHPVVRASLAPFAPLKAAAATVRRKITLTEKENKASGEPESSLIEGLKWTAPATVRAEFGATEVWSIINLTDDYHPFHIHFVPHQLLNKQPFDKEAYEHGKCSLSVKHGGKGAKKRSCFTGPPEEPTGHEVSWKDTSVAPAGYVTRVIIRFGSVTGEALPFDPHKGPGYVFHCHILDHEDNDMMRPLKILPKA